MALASVVSTHIPIALARAKEDFLAREVNLKPQEQLQALYKQMRRSTGRFRASDFLHGNATVSDITQRAIFREVMGVGMNFGEAYGKSQTAASDTIPDRGRAFLSVREADRIQLPGLAQGPVSYTHLTLPTILLV